MVIFGLISVNRGHCGTKDSSQRTQQALTWQTWEVDPRICGVQRRQRDKMACWIRAPICGIWGETEEEKLGKCCFGNFWHLCVYLLIVDEQSYKRSGDSKYRLGANQKSCSFSRFRNVCSKAAGNWETRDIFFFFFSRQDEWMRSLRSCHQWRREEGREAAMAPALPDVRIFDCCCWSWHQSGNSTHLISRERHYPQSPTSSPETPPSLSLSLSLPFCSAGQTEEAVAWEDHTDVQRGDDDKQLKNRHDPLTEIHISCAGSGCSCCHRWCREQRRDGDVSRRTFSFLINRPLVQLSPPLSERL